MTINISYSWQEKLTVNLSDHRIFLQRVNQQTESTEIFYGTAKGWFGDCLIAATDKGVCWLNLAPTSDSLAELQSVWTAARLVRDDSRAKELAQQVFKAGDAQVPLHLCGSDFQLTVWQALLGIRSGHCMTYGQLAACINLPHGARAVGNAVGANGIAILVPCHRVLPVSGGSGRYRWGDGLKKALLEREYLAVAA